MDKEVGSSEATGEPTNASAARGPSPTLVVRRSDDEGRPEVPVMVLRSHSRGAEVLPVPRNLLARQEVSLQEMQTSGPIPLDRENPDRNRKYTTTTLVPLPILSRWVLVSNRNRQELTPPILHKRTLTTHRKFTLATTRKFTLDKPQPRRKFTHICLYPMPPPLKKAWPL